MRGRVGQRRVGMHFIWATGEAALQTMRIGRGGPRKKEASPFMLLHCMAMSGQGHEEECSINCRQHAIIRSLPRSKQQASAVRRGVGVALQVVWPDDPMARAGGM